MLVAAALLLLVQLLLLLLLVVVVLVVVVVGLAAAAAAVVNAIACTSSWQPEVRAREMGHLRAQAIALDQLVELLAIRHEHRLSPGQLHKALRIDCALACGAGHRSARSCDRNGRGGSGGHRLAAGEVRWCSHAFSVTAYRDPGDVAGLGAMVKRYYSLVSSRGRDAHRRRRRALSAAL